jgi:hypothetical protein
MNHTTLDQARAAKAKVLAVFGHDPSVVGVGITPIDEGYGVKLNLGPQHTREASLPCEVDGVPVRVEVVRSSRIR